MKAVQTPIIVVTMAVALGVLTNYVFPTDFFGISKTLGETGFNGELRTFELERLGPSESIPPKGDENISTLYESEAFDVYSSIFSHIYNNRDTLDPWPIDGSVGDRWFAYRAATISPPETLPFEIRGSVSPSLKASFDLANREHLLPKIENGTYARLHRASEDLPLSELAAKYRNRTTKKFGAVIGCSGVGFDEGKMEGLAYCEVMRVDLTSFKFWVLMRLHPLPDKATASQLQNIRRFAGVDDFTFIPVTTSTDTISSNQ